MVSSYSVVQTCWSCKCGVFEFPHIYYILIHFTSWKVIKYGQCKSSVNPKNDSTKHAKIQFFCAHERQKTGSNCLLRLCAWMSPTPVARSHLTKLYPTLDKDLKLEGEGESNKGKGESNKAAIHSLKLTWLSPLEMLGFQKFGIFFSRVFHHFHGLLLFVSGRVNAQFWIQRFAARIQCRIMSRSNDLLTNFGNHQKPWTKTHQKRKFRTVDRNLDKYIHVWVAVQNIASSATSISYSRNDPNCGKTKKTRPEIPTKKLQKTKNSRSTNEQVIGPQLDHKKIPSTPAACGSDSGFAMLN